MKPNLFFVAAAASLFTSSLVGCNARERTEDAAPASDKPAPVETRFAKVELRDLPRTLELTGSLDADQRSDVATQTSGVATEVLVDVGSRVKKGDVLAVLDTREAALRAASAAANTEGQKARLGLDGSGSYDPEAVPDVRGAKDAAELAEKDLERTKALYASGAISPAELERAESNATRARAQLDAARNGVRQAEAALRVAETQAGLNQKALADTRVLAPFDGAIVDKRVSPGEFAPLGRVIATLVADDPLRLRVDVPETELAGLHVDAAVEFTVDALPDRLFHGKVTRIGVVLHPASRTLPIEILVPNPERVLKPGFFATAHIGVEGPPVPALVVPHQAIRQSGETSSIFVKDHERVLERFVVVGRRVGDVVEVTGQVKEGDEVATEHLDALKDSAIVTVGG